MFETFSEIFSYGKRISVLEMKTEVLEIILTALADNQGKKKTTIKNKKQKSNTKNKKQKPSTKNKKIKTPKIETAGGQFVK